MKNVELSLIEEIENALSHPNAKCYPHGGHVHALECSRVLQMGTQNCIDFMQSIRSGNCKTIKIGGAPCND